MEHVLSSHICTDFWLKHVGWKQLNSPKQKNFEIVHVAEEFFSYMLWSFQHIYVLGCLYLDINHFETDFAQYADNLILFFFYEILLWNCNKVKFDTSFVISKKESSNQLIIDEHTAALLNELNAKLTDIKRDRRQPGQFGFLSSADSDNSHVKLRMRSI